MGVPNIHENYNQFTSQIFYENYNQITSQIFHENTKKVVFSVCFNLININFRFTVLDNVLGAERLLVLLPLPSTSPILPNENNKKNLLELFRGLQHPYIHPILDIEFWEAGTALIMPLNPDGSLRDLIYASPWQEEYSEKYHGKGVGLSLKTVR